MEFVTSKKVDITPRGAITNTNPPIRTPMKGVTKSVKDIRRCILAGAKVEEVMPGGGRLLLNITNYNIDNSGETPTVYAPKGHVDKPTAPQKQDEPKKTESTPVMEDKKVEIVEPAKTDEKPAEEVKASENEIAKNETVNTLVETTNAHPEEQPAQSDANRAAAMINTNYTKRQRRASMHVEAQKAAEASEEKVEVKDPEA